MRDQILRELWTVKDRLAEECGHDLRRLFDRLKAVESASTRPVVNRASPIKRAPVSR